MSKSIPDNSKWTLLEAHEPLKQSNADLSNAKDTLALIHDMVVPESPSNATISSHASQSTEITSQGILSNPVIRGKFATVKIREMEFDCLAGSIHYTTCRGTL